MSSLAKSSQVAPHIYIRITQGPNKGDVYRLSPPGAILGRDPSLCQVPLRDQRVSRQQCRLDFKLEGITVEDLSGKGTTLVNLQPIQGEHFVAPGDQISFGDTFISIEKEPAAKPQTSLPSSAAPAQGLLSFPQKTQFTSGTMASSSSSAKPSKMLYYVAGGGLVVALILSFIPDPPKSAPPKIATSETVNEAIEAVKKRQEEIQKSTSHMTELELYNQKSAQKHFIRGSRDYHNGRYGRAMEAFQTALATDPKHTLARRYYSLAEKRREDLVDAHMDLGSKYKQKNMYKMCIAEFEKVLQIINQPSKKKYQLAKEQIKECRLLSQGSP